MYLYKRNLYFTSLLFLGFLGCTPSKRKTSKEGIKISLATNEAPDTAYSTSYTQVNLETKGAPSFLKEVNRIYFDEEKFFILDKGLRKIVIFNSSGKYLSTIDRIGRGPTEYNQLSDFYLDTKNKQIVVLCSRPYKVMFFNYNTEFIKENKIDDLFLQMGSDDKFYYFQKAEMINGDIGKYNLDVYSKDLKFIRSLSPIVGSDLNYIDIVGNSITTGRNLFFSKRYDDNIYHLENGNVTIKYSINFEEATLPEDLQSQSTSDEFFKRVDEKKYVYGIKDVVESDQFVVFQTNQGMYFLNKNNKVLTQVRTLVSSDIKFSLSNYLVLGNTKDQIVFIQDPVRLKSLYEYSITKTKDLNKKFVEIAKNIEDGDNQILFIYKLK